MTSPGPPYFRRISSIPTEDIIRYGTLIHKESQVCLEVFQVMQVSADVYVRAAKTFLNRSVQKLQLEILKDRLRYQC